MTSRSKKKSAPLSDKTKNAVIAEFIRTGASLKSLSEKFGLNINRIQLITDKAFKKNKI